jgi:hypothetical protein
MSSRGLLRHTSLRRYAEGVDWSGFGAAVSLHAHTCYSREVMSDIPAYIIKIPVVGPRFESELERRRAADEAVDFTKGWWHPPVSPRGLFDSEAAQIDRRFGIGSIVSITDHDDINAGLDLQHWFAPGRAPVSVEWTVPFASGFFHLGLHGLPPANAREWFTRLAAFSARTGREPLAGLLHDLIEAGVLVVFNHPIWDLAEVGEATHAISLREFLDGYHSQLHAIEINGYRSWRENGAARRLSSDVALPLISGGDRHGLAPNAVLNLTSARTFAEFAAEVRDGVSHVVVMPEYDEHVTTRILASAAHVMASYPTWREGWRQWTDRVSCETDGEVRPLTYHWPNGGPLWVRAAVGTFRVATTPAALRVWRALLERGGDGPPPVSPIPTAG